jgi:hypothetical protein
MLFEPLNPAFESRVRNSFARRAAMRLIGATLTEVVPGRCAIELPVREALTQQHKFVHGGIVGMIADSAGAHLRKCGGLYADSGRCERADGRIQDQHAGAGAG